MAAITAKKVRLTRDQGGDAIQKALFPSQTVVIDYDNSAGINSGSPISAQVIRVWATSDCFIKIGDADVVAVPDVDIPLTAKVPEYFTLQGHNYISVVIGSGSTSSKLFVSIMT
jgi:hypothetical protein